jgi:ABC-type Co2+ transport system permease subunit
MHIPDGFLANRMALSLDVLSGASILYAARRLRLEISARMIPIMGVLSNLNFLYRYLFVLSDEVPSIRQSSIVNHAI